jgi:hypothetical protein
MTHCITITFLLLIFSSCNQIQEEKNKSENVFSVNPSLRKSLSDTLLIQTSGQRENYLRFYDDKDGYCKLSNDTIMIFAIKGFMTGKRMSIFITNGTFNFNIHEYSCTYGHTFKPLEQRLILNKERYRINDTIVGEMYFKSIYVLDSIKRLIDTTIVTGKFKFKIRNKEFNQDSLTAEQNYNELLIALSDPRADTVKKLSLYNCGLKYLPIELKKFKNIKTLILDDNNLAEVDLSLLGELESLKSLSFQRCNISLFPTAIFRLKSLEELDFFNNNLNEIPSELFKLTKLKVLSLGGNNISSIPNEINNLKDLESFSIEFTNPIKELPDNFLIIHKRLKVFYPSDYMDRSKYPEFNYSL